MEQILQVLCGKRTECIEIRRERILSELSNRNLQVTLRKIPPSVEHLFDCSSLTLLIQSLGGANMWLNTPGYLKEKREFRTKKRLAEIETSSPFRSKKNVRKDPKSFYKDKSVHKKFKSSTRSNSFCARKKK